MAIGNTLANLAVTNDTALKAMELCFKQMGETQKNLAEMYAKQQQAREEKVTADYQKALESLEIQETKEKEALIAATQKVEQKPQSADALTTGEKVKGFFSGIGKSIKGMFCDEKGFSLKRTLTTAAVGAAAAIACTNPIGLAIVAGTGIISGGIHLVKGISNANSAKTKEEAYAAYEDIGGATFEIAGSVAGAKTAAGLKITKGGFTGTYRAAKSSVAKAYEAVRHPQRTYNTYKGSISRLQDKYSVNTDIANTKANVKAQITEKYTTRIARIEAQKEANLAKIAELKQNSKNTAKIEKLEAENKAYDTQIAELNRQIKNLDTETAGATLQQDVKARSQRINELKKQIEENEAAIAEKKKVSSKTEEQKQEIKALEAENQAAATELQNQQKLYAVEIQNRKIQVRKERIEEYQAEIKEIQAKIDRDKKSIETMNENIKKMQNKNNSGKYTATIKTVKETIAKTEKQIASAEKSIADKESIIAKHNAAIKDAELTLKLQNTKATANQTLTNPETIQGIVTTAAVNGAAYGNEPGEAELIEVTTVDPERDEKLALLEEEQLKRRQELEQNYKSTMNQTMINPFLTNVFSTGIDNWAFYKPAF